MFCFCEHVKSLLLREEGGAVRRRKRRRLRMQPLYLKAMMMSEKTGFPLNGKPAQKKVKNPLNPRKHLRIISYIGMELIQKSITKSKQPQSINLLYRYGTRSVFLDNHVGRVSISYIGMERNSMAVQPISFINLMKVSISYIGMEHNIIGIL